MVRKVEVWTATFLLILYVRIPMYPWPTGSGMFGVKLTVLGHWPERGYA